MKQVAYETKPEVAIDLEALQLMYETQLKEVNRTPQEFLVAANDPVFARKVYNPLEKEGAEGFPIEEPRESVVEGRSIFISPEEKEQSNKKETKGYEVFPLVHAIEERFVEERLPQYVGNLERTLYNSQNSWYTHHQTQVYQPQRFYAKSRNARYYS